MYRSLGDLETSSSVESALGRALQITQLATSRRPAAHAHEHRALPDQLPHPVLRAGVHPLVGQHGHLPDVLHQHRADGLLPGRLGRLPGGVAELVVDERAGSAGARDGGVGVRVSLGLQFVQPGHDRRRVAAVAATDLLRDRCAGEGPVEVGRADRGAGRPTSSC